MKIYQYDALVIGAGFAGAVCARELAERGNKHVLVLERRLGDSTITVIADFFSYSDIKNASAYISVNEKVTSKNVGVNGETEFHHILMKMLGSASGTKININRG